MRPAARLVVDELDVLPLDPLALVLGLFALEDVPVELLLQPLVGVVDAELLGRRRGAGEVQVRCR